MQPFSISIDDSVLRDLNERLSRTRWPDELSGEEWNYGTDLGYIKGLCAYWLDGFDWRAAQKKLNQFDQFRTEVDGLGLHFIHQQSVVADALPLVVTHGWPGSVAEFMKIIGPLTDPVAHGGSAEDAFHVVCPSMPGYGFSDRPTEPGFDIRRVGETLAGLMGQLGYTRYGAQGGDWGSLASSWVALSDPEHVCGIHLNMIVARPPRGPNPTQDLTPEELNNLASAAEFRKIETGYQRIQGTKPQTLGYGLNDSPAGLAAWIVEKFYTWGDCKGDVESRFTKDELLTNIMIYWCTQTITSSMRLYCESLRTRNFGPSKNKVETPTGFAVFPGELTVLPRKWAENHYNVVHWTQMPTGGHFAAMEEPELLVEDIRTFFRALR